MLQNYCGYIYYFIYITLFYSMQKYIRTVIKPTNLFVKIFGLRFIAVYCTSHNQGLFIITQYFGKVFCKSHKDNRH